MYFEEFTARTIASMESELIVAREEAGLNLKRDKQIIWQYIVEHWTLICFIFISKED